MFSYQQLLVYDKVKKVFFFTRPTVLFFLHHVLGASDVNTLASLELVLQKSIQEVLKDQHVTGHLPHCSIRLIKVSAVAFYYVWVWERAFSPKPRSRQSQKTPQLNTQTIHSSTEQRSKDEAFLLTQRSSKQIGANTAPLATYRNLNKSPNIMWKGCMLICIVYCNVYV